MKYGLIALVVAALVGCSSNKPEAVKYPASISNLNWDGKEYIRWEGDHSAFPVRKGNLNGWIVIVEPNGAHRPVEQIRPGYTRQHLKNAWQDPDYKLKATKPGDTVRVYLCAMQGNGRPDLEIRSNDLPLVWK